MYLHIKKEAFCINYDKVLLLVLCSVVFANYMYLWVFHPIIGLYSLNSTLLRADKEFGSRTKYFGIKLLTVSPSCFSSAWHCKSNSRLV